MLLKIAPNTLNTFHFDDRLRGRAWSAFADGRASMIVCGALRNHDACLFYLTENPQERPKPAPAICKPSAVQSAPKCLRREEDPHEAHSVSTFGRRHPNAMYFIRRCPPRSPPWYNPTMPHGCSMIRASTSRFRRAQAACEPRSSRHPFESQDESAGPLHTPSPGAGGPSIDPY